jgi:hypothetical protein
MMNHATTNRTNSGLASRRGRRDPDAERELLTLLDGSDAERARKIVPHVARGTFDTDRAQSGVVVERVDDQASGRAVFPVGLRNR